MTDATTPPLDEAEPRIEQYEITDHDGTVFQVTHDLATGQFGYAEVTTGPTEGEEA